ncbi:MAG: hypothetical protein WA705_31700 [Candidatus Ozemobacteraceae bacterium]
MRTRRIFLCGIALLLMVAWHTPMVFGGSIDEAVAIAGNVKFHPVNGWTGGDGVSSIPLDESRVAWLFGDSWYGRVIHGKRRPITMTHNAVAIQTNTNAGDFRKLPQKTLCPPASESFPTHDLRNARISFFFGRENAGKPTSFFDPPDHRGYFWPLHGIRSARGLFVFLIQIEATADTESVFGFHPCGSWLAFVPDADLTANRDPETWRIIYRKIPWAIFSAGKNRFWGSSVLEQNGNAYIYGIEEDQPESASGKRLLLARVSMDTIDSFGTWEFFAQGPDDSKTRWAKDFRRSKSLADRLPTEFSVTRARGGHGTCGENNQGFDLIHSEICLSPYIMRRWAQDPEGPWSEPSRIFRCPEAAKNIFCYAAKAHPEVSCTAGTAIVTYVANSLVFADLVNDASLYWPRFFAADVTP